MRLFVPANFISQARTLTCWATAQQRFKPMHDQGGAGNRRHEVSEPRWTLTWRIAVKGRRRRTTYREVRMRARGDIGGLGCSRLRSLGGTAGASDFGLRLCLRGALHRRNGPAIVLGPVKSGRLRAIGLVGWFPEVDCCAERHHSPVLAPEAR